MNASAPMRGGRQPRAAAVARERILVIKLASLGDFVQAFGPFAAIRAHHPDAEITLLTTPPYVELVRPSPWFDRIWSFGRPRWLDLPAVWHLARTLRRGRFDRVYDLQTSGRSSRYRLFVGLKPEWSGIAWGCSHPHANPMREVMHTLEKQREQLEMAGIAHFPVPDTSFLDADTSGYGLPPRYALLIPGASATRPGKRWDAARYAELASGFDVPVAVVGSRSEAPLAATIRSMLPSAVDLTGRTSYASLAAVARHAAYAVGNDTGPTHLVAAMGCPTLALFGGESDPTLCAPRGRQVAVLRHAPLSSLQVAEVRAALAGLLAS
jgi:ADP-heptose:LPS heptosyltransferase